MTHSAEYLAVLESERWKELSERLRKERGCEMCGHRLFKQYMHVHHLHYWTLGDEDEDLDLLVLCETCHRTADAWRGFLCDAAQEMSLVHDLTPRQILARYACPLLRIVIKHARSLNELHGSLDLGAIALNMKIHRLTTETT